GPAGEVAEAGPELDVRRRAGDAVLGDGRGALPDLAHVRELGGLVDEEDGEPGAGAGAARRRVPLDDVHLRRMRQEKLRVVDRRVEAGRDQPLGWADGDRHRLGADAQLAEGWHAGVDAEVRFDLEEDRVGAMA